MKLIKITKHEDIGKILDYVHDQSFQLSDIIYDDKLGILKIVVPAVSEQIINYKRFLFWEMWSNPVLISELIFKNVNRYSIEDNANIGIGVINTIFKNENQVIVKSSVPVFIKMDISNFELELHITDGIVEMIKRFRFCFKKYNGPKNL